MTTLPYEPTKMRPILEQFFTPKKAVFELLKVLNLEDDDPHVIFEPCVGAGAISTAILDFGIHPDIITNDIDETFPATFHKNAGSRKLWERVVKSKWGNPTWTITNPPFSKAWKIIPLAYEFSTEGVAAYLRLSWLEPCQNRAFFLKKHPPTRLVVLPRISFSGDGKVDSVTGCWAIWDKDPTPIKYPITIIGK